MLYNTLIVRAIIQSTIGHTIFYYFVHHLKDEKSRPLYLLENFNALKSYICSILQLLIIFSRWLSLLSITLCYTIYCLFLRLKRHKHNWCWKKANLFSSDIGVAFYYISITTLWWAFTSFESSYLCVYFKFYFLILPLLLYNYFRFLTEFLHEIICHHKTKKILNRGVQSVLKKQACHFELHRLWRIPYIFTTIKKNGNNCSCYFYD